MHTHFELVSLAVQAQFSCPSAPAVILVGQAGVGKNKGGVEPLAKALSKNLVWLPTPRYESADFNGYPAPDFESGTMRFLAPQWAQKIADDDPSNYVVFLDEVADVDSITKAALHGVVQDGFVADLNLSTAAFILAMNPPEIATTGGCTSHPITNRSLIVWWEPSRNDVSKMMRAGKWELPEVTLLPENWTLGISASMSLVGQFLTLFPQHLRITPEELMERGENIWHPAHTDRSWEHFWILRAAALASGQKHLLADIARGTVGAPGNEFLAWERDLNLGDPEDYLKNPKGLPLPEEDDRAFALANMVVQAAVSNNTPDRWNAAWSFLAYMKDNQMGDIAAVNAPILARNRGKAKGVPADAKPFIPLLQAAGIIKSHVGGEK